MKKIERVYCIGFGALASLYASHLYQLNPNLVTIIVNDDDDERLTRYMQNGFVINGVTYHFHIAKASAVPAADLIFIGVKTHQLPSILPSLKQLLHQDTMVLSILNGISSEAMIAQSIGDQHVLHALAIGMDATRDHHHIRYTQMGTLVFGEQYNHVISSRVLALQSLFDQANIAYQTPVDMPLALWKKFMLNVGVNQVAAAFGANYGDLNHNPYLQKLMKSATQEVWQIAKAMGIALTEQDWLQAVDPIKPLASDKAPSMQQDIQAKRASEVDSFAGEVMRLGKIHQIATPVNETLYHLIRAKEYRNAL